MNYDPRQVYTRVRWKHNADLTSLQSQPIRLAFRVATALLLHAKLGVRADKIMITLAHHGNTSAASIPLALNQAFEQHRLHEGNLVLMEAMGGGFTWGAVLARW